MAEPIKLFKFYRDLSAEKLNNVSSSTESTDGGSTLMTSQDCGRVITVERLPSSALGTLLALS
jgi:hypothetical protein